MTTVLIVDPNPRSREMLRECLAGVPLNLVEAESRAQAEEIYAQSAPQLVFTEIALKDGSALPFVQALKGNSNPAKVVIVARSVSVVNMRAMVQAGALDYILKPYPPAELLTKLNKTLALWRRGIPEEFTRRALNWTAADYESLGSNGEDEGEEGAASTEGAETGADESPRVNYVTLPSTDQKTTAENPAAGRADVLVIDDQPNVTRRFRELCPSNLVIESTSSAEEALVIARQKMFKLVLIDMHLPSVDSGMLLRQLSLFQSGAVIIAMGLRTDSNLLEDARTLGFESVLTKPFEAAKVNDLVDRHFESQDRITISENIVTIATPPYGSAERLAAFYYRISNDMPARLDAVADACYTEVIIDAPSLQGSRKNIVEMLIKIRETCHLLGLELYLVVPPDVVGYTKEFVETRSLATFATVDEALEAISRQRGGGP